MQEQIISLNKKVEELSEKKNDQPKEDIEAIKKPEKKVEKVTNHHGIVCDNCQASPIVGKRFKCLECFDYDLCEKCESSNVHEHNMLLIKNKIPRCLVGRMCGIYQRKTHKKKPNEAVQQVIDMFFTPFAHRGMCERKKQRISEKFRKMEARKEKLTKKVAERSNSKNKQKLEDKLKKIDLKEKIELIDFVFGPADNESKSAIRKEFIDQNQDLGLEEFHKKLSEHKELF